MTQHYSDPDRESDPHALPDIEIWCVSEDDIKNRLPHAEGYRIAEAGWYWWTCFPGCLPDCEPNGPYESEAEALNAAREEAEP